MIKADISNVWGELSLPDLLGIEKEIFAAHQALTEGTGLGSKYLGWLTLPTREDTPELRRIQAAAQRIREGSQVLVVVGIGGSSLGARAGIELMQGVNRNLTQEGTQILYAGDNVSTRKWNELCCYLEGKDFSVLIVSKSGSTTEPAIAARALLWMLERRYGTDEAKTRVYAVTDPMDGVLRQMAQEQGWESFSIPRKVSGRFSVLSPVGLLPMAAAGIDIRQVLDGAMDAKEDCDLRSFDNPAWLYAAVRNLMYRNGKKIEVLESFEPDFRSFGQWWQQLFAESEGKEGKGIFPTYAELPGALHSLGQMLQQGERTFFETVVRFAPPEEPVTIGTDFRNLDGLNYLAGKTLDFVEDCTCLGMVDAHVDGGLPVITLECGPLNPRTMGELFYFMELSCTLSAYLLGVNPFGQPGAAVYKSNLFHLLGKPGYGR